MLTEQEKDLIRQMAEKQLYTNRRMIAYYTQQPGMYDGLLASQHIEMRLAESEVCRKLLEKLKE